jgi:ATP-dependent Clp protease ATP-binding subunit ClpB
MDISNYSQNTKAAIKGAKDLALSMRHPEISCEHLLLYVIRQEGNKVKGILNHLGKSPNFIEGLIEEKLSKFPQEVDIPKTAAASPGMQSILILAGEEQNRLGDSFLEPEHLFISLLDENSSLDSELKRKIGLKKADIYQAISELRVLESITVPTEEKKAPPTSLNYCLDLNQLASSKELDPVIGRDQEILQVVQVLSRRRKNNPVLVGGAGVGKTAIVEGLAQKIVGGSTPLSLADVRIFNLDLGQLIAGAKYKGEFEERFKNLISEITKSGGKIILFIDEIHTIVGAGNPAGGLDAANLIKPALARGQIKLIGATTQEEYAKFIEKDKALDRRFQKVVVEEPDIDSAVKILEGAKDNYEKHHRIRLSPQAIRGAVKFSKRYLGERLLPDKALDLIDEALAQFRVNYDLFQERAKVIDSQIKEMQKKLELFEKKGADWDEAQIQKLDEKIRELSVDNDKLIEPWLHRIEV